ncbi:MAG: hypothetical protein P8Y08_01530, partial [Desulfobulbaceae bacterium]
CTPHSSQKYFFCLHCRHSSAIWCAFSFVSVNKSWRINILAEQHEHIPVIGFIAVTIISFPVIP